MQQLLGLKPTTTTAAAEGATTSAETAVSVAVVCQWIVDLADQSKRDNALFELSKCREQVGDLGVWLWHSYGTVAVLMQEIVSTYSFIIPPTLTAHQSSRICNVLALMQCIAAHKDTREEFLAARIPLYLYPFLRGNSDSSPVEYLRLTALGVIGAMVKTDKNEAAVHFLLLTDIVPMCLRIMDEAMRKPSDPSKATSKLPKLSCTVAALILEKVLVDHEGLAYVCHTYERFSHIVAILGRTVVELSKDPSSGLLRHLVRCYHRLSENGRATHALVECLPEQLKDGTFKEQLEKDRQTKQWWMELMQRLSGDPRLVSERRVTILDDPRIITL